MRLSGGECAIVLGGGGVKVIGWRAHQWEAVWPNCPLDWDATCDDITVFWLLLTIYCLLLMFTILCFTLFILAPQGALSLVLIQQADTFSPVTHGHYYRQRRKMLHIKARKKDAIHACKVNTENMQ